MRAFVCGVTAMAGEQWRNRIVSHGIQPADQFTAHPNNPKFHPQFQRKVITSLLGSIGWVDEVKVSAQSGFILDGHERIWAALEKGDSEPVPYALVDVTPEEELQILATFDPSGWLSGHDADLLDDLLAQVSSDDENIQQLLAALVDTGVPLSDVVDDSAGDEPLTVPDAIFPSDNDYEIPLLDINLQARSFDLPFSVYGTQSRRTKMGGGTVAFYIDDYRFEALWRDPSNIVRSGVTNMVEPNFSCYASMPVAVGAYQIYRKRWIARWCQTHGVRVLVDLNVAPKWRTINLMGVPLGWSAYMTRSSVEFLHELDEEFALACEHAQTTTPLFVVYGGGKQSQAVCKQRGWLWIADQETSKRRMVTEIDDGE